MDTDKLYAEQLANEYAPKKASNVIALRKLDRKAKLPATVFAYVFGVVFTLIFGTGLSLSVGAIGLGTAAYVTLGAVIGTIGLIGVGTNYAIYKHLLEKGKQKYAFEIVQLAKEIAESR